MYIEWTKVTWYSSAIAVVLIFGIFFVGIRVGRYKMRLQSQVEQITSVSDQWAKTSSTGSATSNTFDDSTL